jgi:hypothetical protein
MIIAGVAAVALTGCCCSRRVEEVKYAPAPEVPECSYTVRDGGQVVYSERYERAVAMRQTVKAHPGKTACAAKPACVPECGHSVQRVQVAQPAVARRSYVLVPVTY